MKNNSCHAHTHFQKNKNASMTSGEKISDKISVRKMDIVDKGNQFPPVAAPPFRFRPCPPPARAFEFLLAVHFLVFIALCPHCSLVPVKIDRVRV